MSVLLLVSVLASSASAEKPARTERSKATMTVIGKVDKDGNFTPADGSAGQQGDVGTTGVSYGECGTSWIWPYSEGFTDTLGNYHTRLRVDLGAQSTLGAIVHISWFWSASGPGYYYNEGTNWPFWPFSSTWTRTDYKTNILPGTYTTTLTVRATLVSGAVCEGVATDVVIIN
jgi:hypothetical protein